MSGKNESYVAIVPQLDCAWTYKIRSNTQRISKSIEETLRISEVLFRCFDDFIEPTKIKYPVILYGDDYKVSNPFGSDSDIKPIDSMNKLVTSNGRISYDALRNSVLQLDYPDNTVPYLNEIEFCRLQTKIYIDGEYRKINKGDEGLLKIWSRTDKEVIDNPPFSDLLSISLSRSGNGNFYYLTVSTATDVWFADTNIGQRNREMLSQFLTCLYNNIYPIEVEYLSNYHESPMSGFIN